MNRLQQELQRLYGPPAGASLGLDLDARGLVDEPGRVRAMVLELARPADWAALSAVWGGVQADLGLPAPAIAVNGSDGFQLWFSLLEPLPVPRAAAFLDALRRRYLGDIAPARVTMLPALDAAPARLPLHAWQVPALQADSGLWSAYVASDLVTMFADEPGLDMPPNPDGQAQLLEPLKLHHTGRVRTGVVAAQVGRGAGHARAGIESHSAGGCLARSQAPLARRHEQRQP